MNACPCGSGRDFEQCCGPLLAGERQPETAEALMRARYTAYAKADIAFLTESLHPDHRFDHDEAATRRWAERSEWLGLEIVETSGGQAADDEGEVEFIATFKEKGAVRRHHERSRFRRQAGRWYFVDGEPVAPRTRVNAAPKVGRNDPCPCGSGRKYKKCCGG
jgi:SEC-C motif-containing protein